MITQVQKGKNYFYQISLAMLVAMMSIVGCKKNEPVGPTPVIIDFKATSGWAGDVVRIQGSDFDAIAANNIVKFGDKVAVVNTVSNDFLTYNSNGSISMSLTKPKPVALLVTIPTGATTGKISVTVNGVTGTSTTDFMVNTGTVYILGEKGGEVGYWKNGSFVKKAIGGTPKSLLVGNDIYFAYSKLINSPYRYDAGYIKNDASVSVGNGVNWSNANAITVVNNDVYVAGCETNASFIQVAKYWKNGVATVLTDGTKNATAFEIAVLGNDVHVIGDELNTSKYWKNGIAVNLSSVSGVAYSSFLVSGNDLYVSGQEADVATYWKNGVATRLGDVNKQGYVYSMQIVGNDIYAFGGEYNSTRTATISKYWKNGVDVNLTNGIPLNAGETYIQIAGSDVHVINTQNGVIKYYKNGILASTISGQRATGIVVIP